MIEGTVIRLQVDRLPSGATPKPVWLWWSRVDHGWAHRFGRLALTP